MITRAATPHLLELAQQFKAVAVVGPRQSGKTTLVRSVFAGKTYVSLEDPDTRSQALTDPRSFLLRYPDGAIIDEAQRAPDLFSYLQGILDSSDARGRFILTGSNHFLLQENISQSLAGRIAYLNLMPFSLQELPDDPAKDADDRILEGGYPPVHDGITDRTHWFANYLRTYVERDVRQVRNITGLITFERFMRLCAGRVGQLLNHSNLGVEAGVDSKTAASWISVLVGSFIVQLLQPYHTNHNKRLVKMPKLYFVDTGLACALLGIHRKEHLQVHPLRGALFENLVVSDIRRSLGHQGRLTTCWFWRDHKGHEVDLLLEDGARLTPIEIKSGRTLNAEFFAGLDYWRKLSGVQEGIMVHGGEDEYMHSNGTRVVPWRHAGAMISSTRD